MKSFAELDDSEVVFCEVEVRVGLEGDVVLAAGSRRVARPCFLVQICTRKRVWAHVQRTAASVSLEPPSSSSGTGAVAFAEGFEGAEDFRNIERSK